MRILITGGAGFIGSNLVRLMLEKHPDYEIIVYDKLTYAGNLDNLKGLESKPNYKFIKGDVCNLELLNHIFKDVDGVLHLAAESHVDNSIEDSLKFTTSNTLGTHAVLEAARRNGVKKIVYISTDEVYGSIEEGSFKEGDMLKPNSPYSASKTSGDLLARAFFSTYKLPVTITRSSNNFGPYQHPEKLIPLFITNLLEGKKVPLYGDGLNVRDWIFVQDNCEAIDFVFHNGVPGEIYNIGRGNEKTNREITEKVLKLLNKDESSIEYVQDRPGHDRRYSLSSSKLNAMGWSPSTNFEDALKKTAEWYKENEGWWKPLKDKMGVKK
jgi:dTDP-glucose 4,6-dehydratase